MGIELAMLGLQVRQPNHYATLPRAHVARKKILEENFSYIKDTNDNQAHLQQYCYN